MVSPPPGENFAHLLRELAPPVLGIMVRRYRDFDAAEDAVQEALVAAAVQWPRDGIPDNPRSWLIRVARRKMIDRLGAKLRAEKSSSLSPTRPSLPCQQRIASSMSIPRTR